MSSIIYLDNNATTRPDSRVVEAMLPYLYSEYANASSNHYFGQTIKKDIEKARETIAQLISGQPSGMVFTSGATEAINTAVKGIALSATGKHIVTVETEHLAVLDTCRHLETIGYDVTYLPVNDDGLVNLEELQDSIRDDTALVSIMMVNNETGVI
ncbi:MAG: cysteine desulfurase family protein, partial [Cyclobacteriaceae bacterium]